MYFQKPIRKFEKSGINFKDLQEIQKTWKIFQKTYANPDYYMANIF